MMIQVCLAEDQYLFRKGIASILSRFPDIQVVYEAVDGLELINYIEKNPLLVDVVLLDLTMPGLSGPEVLTLITTRFSSVKVIVLSVHIREDFVVKAIEMGAHAYLSKDASPEELLEAITTVFAKGFYFNDLAIQAMKSRLQDTRKLKTFDPVEIITKREKDVLELICRQLTTSEIAEKLFISERTVEGHRNNLLGKTGARNMVGLVLFAVKNNLVNDV